MWLEVRKARTRMIAEMWHELLEGEGIPVLVLPETPGESGEFDTYRILVPQFRDTVVAEVLRKL